jgi:hypothetical protein
MDAKAATSALVHLDSNSDDDTNKSPSDSDYDSNSSASTFDGKTTATKKESATHLDLWGLGYRSMYNLVQPTFTY